MTWAQKIEEAQAAVEEATRILMEATDAPAEPAPEAPAEAPATDA